MDGLSLGAGMRAVKSDDQFELKTRDAVIHFAEGLIGLAECKDFVLVENQNFAPFRLLQSVDSPQVGFLVLEATTVVTNFYDYVPVREWDSIGIGPTRQLAFVIVAIGPTPETSTANFQAPLLVNYEKMMGKQVILTDAVFSVRHPLV
jgi:flagellar assembly factor FliW